MELFISCFSFISQLRFRKNVLEKCPSQKVTNCNNGTVELDGHSNRTLTSGMIQQNISLIKEVVCLQDRVEKEHRQRTKFNESWKSSIGELLVEHNENVFNMDYEIK